MKKAFKNWESPKKQQKINIFSSAFYSRTLPELASANTWIWTEIVAMRFSMCMISCNEKCLCCQSIINLLPSCVYFSSIWCVRSQWWTTVFVEVGIENRSSASSTSLSSPPWPSCSCSSFRGKVHSQLMTCASLPPWGKLCDEEIKLSNPMTAGSWWEYKWTGRVQRYREKNDRKKTPAKGFCVPNICM